MREQISPATSVSGAIELPGDKSISHRYGMLAAIAEGTSKIANYSTGADCQSTLGCMRALGAEMNAEDGVVIIHGGAWTDCASPPPCWTPAIRARPSACSPAFWPRSPSYPRIGGDESLSRRPMERIIKPLAQMGARIEARENRFPPLTIHGGKLHRSIIRCRWPAPR